MLQNLACWLLGFLIEECSLQNAQLLADSMQKTAATLAIVGAAVWGYFRFVRGRTFKRRLECEVTGEALRGGGQVHILVTASARNVGLSRVKIDLEQTGLRIFTHAAQTVSAEGFAATAPKTQSAAEPGDDEREDSPYLAQWKLLDTVSVLEGLDQLEPGEPRRTQLLVEIPAEGGFHAVRLELWVASPRRPLGFSGKRWLADAVVRTETRGDNEAERTGKHGE